MLRRIIVFTVAFALPLGGLAVLLYGIFKVLRSRGLFQDARSRRVSYVVSFRDDAARLPSRRCAGQLSTLSLLATARSSANPALR